MVAASSLLLGLLASPASAASAQRGRQGGGVIPPTARVGGKTYGQWSAAQWPWSLESPNLGSNPNADPNPGTPTQPESVDCAAGQSGRVWFLAGATFAEPYSTTYRACTIPTGRFLFFPVVDSWNDDLNCPGQPPFTLTAQQLASLVSQQTDAIIPGSMNVTIDGVAVKGLGDSSTRYRAAAPGFSYSLPANNLLSAFCPGNPFPAGSSPPPPGAFADGVYIMHAPLSVGVHRFHWTAQVGNGPFGPGSQDVTYTITVIP